MAEILIKGMEMPTRCGKCDLRTYCRNKEGNMVTVCSRLKREIPSLNLDEVRMADCPLVELPPHGALKDEMYVINEIDRQFGGNEKTSDIAQDIQSLIMSAPTILEASKVKE